MNYLWQSGNSEMTELTNRPFKAANFPTCCCCNLMINFKTKIPVMEAYTWFNFAVVFSLKIKMLKLIVLCAWGISADDYRLHNTVS